MELVYFLLDPLDIEPLVLPLLYCFAYRSDRHTRVVAGPDDAMLDGIDLFVELRPQIAISLLELESPMELKLRRLNRRATVTIRCADYGIVEVRKDICDVELGIDEGDPRFLPGLGTVDYLDHRALAVSRYEQCNDMRVPITFIKIRSASS